MGEGGEGLMPFTFMWPFILFAKLLKLTCMFVPRGKEISVHMRIAKMVG